MLETEELGLGAVGEEMMPYMLLALANWDIRWVEERAEL